MTGKKLKVKESGLSLEPRAGEASSCIVWSWNQKGLSQYPKINPVVSQTFDVFHQMDLS